MKKLKYFLLAIFIPVFVSCSSFRERLLAGIANGYMTPSSGDNQTSKKTSSKSSSTVARRKFSVSERNLIDDANYVSGTYTGSGYLAQKGKVIEEYSAMKVVVMRIDNNMVNIDVVENGESYFSSKTIYQIKKKDKNTYVLSLDGISDAFVTIDNAGHLTYIHPKVNIDGEIYTLNITANKSRGSVSQSVFVPINFVSEVPYRLPCGYD